MKKILKYILDIIFPIECVGCGEEACPPYWRGKWLCDYCFSKIEFNKKQICPLCGRFLDMGNSCSCAVNMGVDVYITFVDLGKNPVVAKLIHCLKYNFIKDIAEILARVGVEFFEKTGVTLLNSEEFPVRRSPILGILAPPLKLYATRGRLLAPSNTAGRQNDAKDSMINPDDTIFIPMPLHKRRMLWRGFNQAELILERVSAETQRIDTNKKRMDTDINIRNDILVRTKNTLFQGKSKMREKDRKENMKDAFKLAQALTHEFTRIKNGSPRSADGTVETRRFGGRMWKMRKDLGQHIALDGKTVVLFDDVITTGATMESAARVLKEAGANRVIGMAVGKG